MKTTTGDVGDGKDLEQEETDRREAELNALFADMPGVSRPRRQRCKSRNCGDPSCNGSCGY